MDPKIEDMLNRPLAKAQLKEELVSTVARVIQKHQSNFNFLRISEHELFSITLDCMVIQISNILGYMMHKEFKTDFKLLIHSITEDIKLTAVRAKDQMNKDALQLKK